MLTRLLSSPRTRSARSLVKIETLESRQLLSAAVASSTPFSGTPMVAGQLVEAENFDLGGPGVAYQIAWPSAPISTGPMTR